MSDNPSGGAAPVSAAARAASSHLPRWLLPAVIALGIGVCALVIWLTSPGTPPVAAPSPAPNPTPATSPTPAPPPFHVFLRPPTRGTQPLSVEEKGALPVGRGWIMSMQATLDEPAYAYFVWLDNSGNAVPLYPWNTTELEVKDIHEPPPIRQKAATVYSPLLGGGWTFGDREGLETVLLLVRKTPLPEGESIGKLLGNLPPPVGVREPTELVVFEVKDQAKTVTTVLSQARGDEAAAKAADEPLQALLLRLSPHFDLVRAVRFAHVGADQSANE